MSELTGLTTNPAANLRAFIEKYWPEQEDEGSRLYESQVVVREIGVMLCAYASIVSKIR